MNVCMLALFALAPAYSGSMIGPSCVGGTTRALGRLIEPISVAENDTRYGMHEGGPKFGLSPEEQTWLGKTTGKILCPNDDGRPLFVGNAAMMGRNDTVVTNAHVLFDDSGASRIDWEYCVFSPSSNPGVRLKFKLEDPGTRFGSRSGDRVIDQDYAILRLEAPIKGVKPIPVFKGIATMKKGDQMLLVSARAFRMKPDRVVKSDEPIIQTCEILNITKAQNGRGGSLRTDCSTTGGTSGSLGLVRDERGQLAGLSLHVRSDGAEFDGKPAGPGTDDVNALSMTLEGPFITDFRKAIDQQTSL